MDPYIFYVNVDRQQSTYILRLGSSELHDCVSVHVFPKRPYADLHGIMYNELCASNIPLKKEDRGTVKMVWSMMKATLYLFPYVTHFHLTDMSTVECKELGRNVILADMYFYLHGKTWYEATFHAHPSHIEYQNLRHAFQQKPSLSFQIVWSYMPRDLANKKRIHSIYKMSKDWHDFFRQWHAIDGCVPFLYIHSSTGNTLMRDIYSRIRSLHGTEWTIEASRVDLESVKVHKVTAAMIPKIAWSTKTQEVKRLFGGEMYLGNANDFSDR